MSIRKAIRRWLGVPTLAETRNLIGEEIAAERKRAQEASIRAFQQMGRARSERKL